MKRLILATFLPVFAFATVGFSFAAGTVHAQFDAPIDEVCKGLDMEDSSAVTPDGKAIDESCTDDAATQTEQLVARIINLLSAIIGIIAVIMIIINGLRFITANGDANSVSSARNGIIYAIVGLIIVAMAQLIVRFVLKTATGS
mgnify:CR=1 FL=1